MQLSNAINSDNQTEAATPRAVRDALEWVRSMGLGEVNARNAIDLNDEINTGWVSYSSSTLNRPVGTGLGTGVVMSIRRTSAITAQVAYAISTSNNNLRVLTRQRVSGVWTSWEETGGSKLKSIVFDSYGTYNWTVPSGAEQVYLTAVAGGGGGGGGGGAGGGVVNLPVVVTPNESITITIGAGGANGVAVSSSAQAGQEAGSAGGVTSFGNKVSLMGGSGAGTANSAGGGGRSIPVYRDTLGGSHGTAGGHPYDGTGGVAGYVSGDGGNGGLGGTALNAIGGGGGASSLGNGGDGKNNGTKGEPGVMGGGGGRGTSRSISPSYDPSDGGRGGDGYMLIEWWE